MTAPIYRPETYEADMVLAARDLLGHAWSVADEDLKHGETQAGQALADAHDAIDDLCGVAEVAAIGDGPDDPVRSVRAAIALLWVADADGPGEGWGAVAEDLERRLWARGPVVDADDVARACWGCAEALGEHEGTPDASGKGLLCDDCAGACGGEA